MYNIENTQQDSHNSMFVLECSLSLCGSYGVAPKGTAVVPYYTMEYLHRLIVKKGIPIQEHINFSYQSRSKIPLNDGHAYKLYEVNYGVNQQGTLAATSN